MLQESKPKQIINEVNTPIRSLIFAVAVSVLISQGFTLQRSLRSFSLLDGIWLLVFVLLIPLLLMLKGKGNQRAFLYLQAVLISVFLFLYPAYTAPGDYTIEIFGLFIKNSGAEMQIIILSISVLQVLTLAGAENDKKMIVEFGILGGTLLAGINLFIVLAYGWTMYLLFPLILTLFVMLYLAMVPSTSIDSETQELYTKNASAKFFRILGVIVLMVYPFLYSAFSFDRPRYMAAYSMSLIFPGLISLGLWLILQIPNHKKGLLYVQSRNYYKPILMMFLAVFNLILLSKIYSKNSDTILKYFRSNEYFIVLSIVLFVGILLLSSIYADKDRFPENGIGEERIRAKNIGSVVYPIVIIAALWQGSSMIFSWNPTKDEPFIISASVIGFGFLLCILSLILYSMQSRKSRIDPK